MSWKDALQRILREEKCFRGKGKSYVQKSEVHSAFLKDGNIVSRKRTETPLLKGIAPQSPGEVAGQCQSCLCFVTVLLLCDHCSEVVCQPCCAQSREKKNVCPACAEYLRRRRWILLLRELFIEPFVERIG